MRFRETVGFLFVIPLFLIISSCSARIDGVVREGGAAEITLKTSLEPRTAAVIRSLKNFMGEAADAPIIDGPEMSKSMSATPGIRSVSLKNTGPTALEGSISISNVGHFLLSDDERSRFITYTESRSPGSSSILIALDRNSAPFIIASLSPEAEEYLSALMAPAVLGEKSTRQEYLGLLTMVYGRALSDEVANAVIRVLLEFPRPVTSVKGGKAAGKQAEFNIPLAELLVLENALSYEIKW